MAQVKAIFADVTVEFIGNGGTRPFCERLARELGLAQQCRFSGGLPHREVLAQMAKSSAVVVPSLKEAFGLVNIEAMSVGVPVLASRTGGIVEIVRDGVDGFLFPPGDHGELARRMITLLSDEPLRSTLGTNARQRFLQRFESHEAVQTQGQWIISQVKNALMGVSFRGSQLPVPKGT